MKYLLQLNKLSMALVLLVVLSACGSPSATPETTDLQAIQGTAIAQAWELYTQTAAAMPTITQTFTPRPTNTVGFTNTIEPTFTTIPTFTALPLPTNTLVVIIIPTQAPAVGVCSCGGDSLNCSDFSSHSSAQSCYDYCVSVGAGDIHGLDKDGDGDACESL